MRSLLIATLVLFTVSACRERYGLPLEALMENLLVVEGNIIDGDTTKIRLSRTSPIGERSLISETGALLQIEGADNSVYQLTESQEEPGLYKSDSLTLNKLGQYRLKIACGGKEYESEWLNVISTPEIDSVFWRRENGVEIFVASRGSADDARYYKLDYDEVWEFHADFQSKAYFTYVVDANGEKQYQCIDVTRNGITYNSCVEAYFPPEAIRANDSMYYCWKYFSSSNINIASTAALSENTLVMPVRKIEEDTWELGYLYSILVKQTGLSKEGYEFYRILKSNSEGMGTIFDPQPSQMRTNLKCISDPREVVLGFIDATTVVSKRLFISNRELPGWRYDAYTCYDTLTNADVPYADAIASGLVPVEVLNAQRVPPYRILSYSLTDRHCGDCRLRGVHRRPAFWP